MLRAVLIDDDDSNLSALSEKLSRHCPQIDIIDRCDNAPDGMKTIESHKPDIVFLDIEMPVMNGFVMLQQLNYKNFELIFVTAYDHYAIKAIRYSALDYLVKPVEIEELKSAVLKAEANRSNRSSNLQLDLCWNSCTKKNLNALQYPPRMDFNSSILMILFISRQVIIILIFITVPKINF